MNRDQAKETGVSIDRFTNKVELLEVKLNQIDRKLSNKADDVVMVQVYQHRRELEELYQTVEKIEAHLQLIDGELSRMMTVLPEGKVSQPSSHRATVTPLFT